MSPVRTSSSAVLGASEGARTALADLRAQVAAVTLSRESSVKEIETARNTLREMGRQANLQIRAVDVQSAGDQVAGQCFAARALVSEAQGQIAANGWNPDEALPLLVRGRRALYRALCLVVRSLVEDAIARPSGFVPRTASSGSKHPAATFVRLVRSMAVQTPLEIGWALEVAECELAIALLDRRALDEDRRESLTTLHGEASAWANDGRDPAAGAALFERMRAQAEELDHDVLGPPSRR